MAEEKSFTVGAWNSDIIEGDVIVGRVSWSAKLTDAEVREHASLYGADLKRQRDELLKAVSDLIAATEAAAHFAAGGETDEDGSPVGYFSPRESEAIDRCKELIEAIAAATKEDPHA